MAVSLAFEVAAELAEPLSDALMELGAASVSVEDARAGTPEEDPRFDEPGTERGPWALSRLIVVCDNEAAGRTLVREACVALGVDAPARIDAQAVAEQDWVRATQSQFAPIRVSQRMWVMPSWHSAPDPQALNIIIDPGQAFGTGSHPTTRLCLGWLERHVRPGDQVLDYGCGSGILGIAALMLGAGRATGVDVDPLALEAARYNSRRNHVQLDTRDASSELPSDADITVANILANPLRMLAPLLATHTRIGGLVALSGILADQAQSVIDAYEPWMELSTAEAEAGWVLLAGRRER